MRIHMQVGCKIMRCRCCRLPLLCRFSRCAAVAESRILNREHGIEQLWRLLKRKTEVSAGQNWRDTLHALQRLDAALRLFGLGGLGLETVNEFLQMGDFFLLACKGRLLQHDLLGAHFFKCAPTSRTTNTARGPHRHQRGHQRLLRPRPRPGDPEAEES